MNGVCTFVCVCMCYVCMYCVCLCIYVHCVQTSQTWPRPFSAAYIGASFYYAWLETKDHLTQPCHRQRDSVLIHLFYFIPPDLFSSFPSRLSLFLWTKSVCAWSTRKPSSTCFFVAVPSGVPKFLHVLSSIGLGHP